MNTKPYFEMIEDYFDYLQLTKENFHYIEGTLSPQEIKSIDNLKTIDDVLVGKKPKSFIAAFVNLCRKAGLNDAQIYAGLLLKKSDTNGNWSVQDVFAQVGGAGTFMSEKTYEKYGEKDKVENFKQAGKEIFDDIKEGERTTPERIVSTLSSIKKSTSTYAHELSDSLLKLVMDTVKRGYRIYKHITDNRQLRFEGKLKPTKDFKAFMTTLNSELQRMSEQFDDEEGTIEKVHSNIDSIVKKGLAWEMSSETISDDASIEKYFDQLKASAPEQQERMKPQIKKDKKKKKEKAMRSEGSEYASIIRSVGEELRQGKLQAYSTHKSETNVKALDEATKLLNKKASEIAKQKLGTGRSVATYLASIKVPGSHRKMHDDPETQIYADLEKHISEHRGKSAIEGKRLQSKDALNY